MNKRNLGTSLASERSALLLGTIWVAVLAASLAWNWRQVGDSMMVLAESEACLSFEKDLVYRHWVSLHGGVYVPPTEATPPNPYLAHLPHRDVTAASGEQLTLINPAYMTRQVHALGKQQYGLQGHITSLNPIRPENSPDAWETEALRAFQGGIAQATSVEVMDDSAYFRLMRPLMVQESCMTCHTEQGYAVGDIIGGISVSVPLHAYMKQVGSQRTALACIHLLLGFVGLIGIGTGHRLLRATEMNLRASEQHLSATLRSIGDGVIACDRAGRVTSLNQVAETLTGWTTAEATGRPLEEVFRIVHAHTRQTVDNPVARALAEGMNVDLANHTVLIARDGTERQIADSCAPIRDAGGDAIGAVLVFRDVSEEYRWREELQEFKTAVAQSGEGIALTDMAGHIRFVNHAWAAMHGYLADELIGRHLSVFHTREQLEKEVAPFTDRLIACGSNGGEVGHLRKDRTTFPTQMTTTVVKGADGQPFRLLGIARDITEEVDRRERERFDNRFRKLVAEVSARFVQVTDSRSFDEAVDGTLAALGKLFGVDRSYLFRFSDDLSTMDNTHEWCSPGVTGQKARIRQFTADSLPWWTAHMLELRPMLIPAVAALPAEAAAEKVEFQAQGIQSLICLPITDQSRKLIGFMGFDAVRAPHIWPEEQVGMLQVLAEVIGSAVLRMEAFRAVAESEDRHRIAFEQSQDAVMTLAPPSWEFTSGNPATVRMFGADDAEELVALGPWDVSPEYQPDGHLSSDKSKVMIEAAMRDGSHYFEWTHMRLDGTEFPTTVLLSRMQASEETYLQAVVRDITEQKHTEDALRDANEKLQHTVDALESANRALEEFSEATEAANRAKSEFLANMSHEIRTPMTAILGFADVLCGEPGLDRAPPERIEAIETIRRNGNYLLKLINDILDLSKIEAGKLEVERTACSPVQVLEEVLALMRVRGDAKNIPLKLEYAGAIPEVIRCDPLRLKQILINLVGNAVKFTETGSVRMVARLLRPPAKPALLQVEVIDTGIGLTEEQASRLFQPFSQADASTTRKFGGTGLGLTISKRLAEMLGGGITLHSEPGKGSTFSVTVKTGDLEGVRLLDGPTEAAAPATPAPPVGNAAPPVRLDGRILLAEDGPDNQRLIAFVLKKAGAEVTVAENGQIAHDEALAARARGEPFDLILMDMQMPVMDGYTATAKLRAAGYTGPIVALTAHAMAGDDTKCLAAGCDGYLTKPIDRAVFLPAVAERLKPSLTTSEQRILS